MGNVFGFSTAPSTGGDFLPILKYDARAGRFFRVDRGDAGQGYETTQTDITEGFKAVFDLENIEVGWMLFMPGQAPSCALVPMNDPMPPRPTPEHRNGVRFLVKLAKPFVGPDGKAIREVMGTSKAFLSGIEALYVQYTEDAVKHPLKLPAATLLRTTPVKTGSGQNSSTNYMPVFKITSWEDRKDLKPQPRVTNGSGQTAAAPATGATTRSAPGATVTNIADEF
jgi:hypothetical protein